METIAFIVWVVGALLIWAIADALARRELDGSRVRSAGCAVGLFWPIAIPALLIANLIAKARGR